MKHIIATLIALAFAAGTAHAMGSPRGVASCDRAGHCHQCQYVGNGTWDCR